MEEGCNGMERGSIFILRLILILIGLCWSAFGAFQQGNILDRRPLTVVCVVRVGSAGFFIVEVLSHHQLENDFPS